MVLPLIVPEAMRPELVMLSPALRPTTPHPEPTMPPARLSMVRLPPPVETMPPVMSPALVMVVAAAPFDWNADVPPLIVPPSWLLMVPPPDVWMAVLLAVTEP